MPPGASSSGPAECPIRVGGIVVVYAVAFQTHQASAASHPGRGDASEGVEPQERDMPYDKLSELPKSVRDSLPKHAQEIYREAFNSAWNEYKNPAERRGDASREETAHRVAWAAVKSEYEKDEQTGKWKRKQGEE